MSQLVIDATGMHYTPLNQQIRQAVRDGVTDICVNNVMGQRFIADGLSGDVKITVNGVAGGDLGMFMNGPTIEVHGNADHAPGNTMDHGLIVIHGSSGDATAHSMRGGKVYVRDDIGYRGGIHMKQYQEKRPILVVGRSAHAFLGEYMAGGLIILLRIGEETRFDEMGLGSGIHGGAIYIRGGVEDWSLGVGSKKEELRGEELSPIEPYIREFCTWFGLDPELFLKDMFTRIVPISARPFAGKYTWE